MEGETVQRLERNMMLMILVLFFCFSNYMIMKNFFFRLEKERGVYNYLQIARDFESQSRKVLSGAGRPMLDSEELFRKVAHVSFGRTEAAQGAGGARYESISKTANREFEVLLGLGSEPIKVIASASLH